MIKFVIHCIMISKIFSHLFPRPASQRGTVKSSINKKSSDALRGTPRFASDVNHYFG